MKALFMVPAILISIAAHAETKTVNYGSGTYIIMTQEISDGKYRETIKGKNSPFLSIGCNGGGGSKDGDDILLVSGESMTLKDASGDINILNCL